MLFFSTSGIDVSGADTATSSSSASRWLSTASCSTARPATWVLSCFASPRTSRRTTGTPTCSWSPARSTPSSSEDRTSATSRAWQARPRLPTEQQRSSSVHHVCFRRPTWSWEGSSSRSASPSISCTSF
ncbi:hypothetical protein MUK42_18767 [Musa troglodytarum]|uniref:Uncharacterized protein n=1 Tax=Musa troglodytarum TaxID=320322 RepID=A0A9E7G6N4_9LILI|nr:hypothetical protein MUK42_18767 [Musa troglodytarum]